MERKRINSRGKVFRLFCRLICSVSQRTYEVNKLLMNIIELKQSKRNEKSHEIKMQSKSNEKTCNRTNSFVASVHLQTAEKVYLFPRLIY